MRSKVVSFISVIIASMLGGCGLPIDYSPDTTEPQTASSPLENQSDAGSNDGGIYHVMANGPYIRLNRKVIESAKTTMQTRAVTLGDYTLYNCISCNGDSDNTPTNGGLHDSSHLTKGYISCTNNNGGSIEISDKCHQSTGDLVEYGCNGKSPFAVHTICPDAYVCQDGACVPKDPCPDEDCYCTDSDNTQSNPGPSDPSLFVKGTTTGMLNGVHQSLDDKCHPNGMVVVEYDCKNDGVSVGVNAIDCPNNSECIDGHCVQ